MGTQSWTNTSYWNEMSQQQPSDKSCGINNLLQGRAPLFSESLMTLLIIIHLKSISWPNSQQTRVAISVSWNPLAHLQCLSLLFSFITLLSAWNDFTNYNHFNCWCLCLNLSPLSFFFLSGIKKNTNTNTGLCVNCGGTFCSGSKMSCGNDSKLPLFNFLIL